MTEIKLFNTLSRKIEPIQPHKDGTVNLYTCGPTVYDHAHIGNLRSYIFADVLRRTLESNGLDVRWVMNITDVDDKTIKKTIEEFGEGATVGDLETYTSRYFDAFLKDLAEINIPEESIEFVKVSDRIPEIINFIKELIKKDYAYKAADGSMYFSIERYEKDFGDYGALVGQDFLKGKKIGARVKSDEYEKENLSDFALWKATGPDDAKIFWSDSELGDGRPGWHIECSVINYVAFGGEPTDIHTGGVDLIFPHHTNEIAQSRPIVGEGNFVRHWAHCEHLLVENKKMAKSANNFYTLEDLKKEVPDTGMAFRYLTLQTSYRNQMNFLRENMTGAYNAVRRLLRPENKKSIDARAKQNFEEALRNDLNTAQALAAIQEAQSDTSIVDFLEILGISFKNIEIPVVILELAQKREEARRNKQFAQSDSLREEIDRLGYEVNDTPDGPVVRPK
jgi:cysteinyl-tRNA synthetase